MDTAPTHSSIRDVREPSLPDTASHVRVTPTALPPDPANKRSVRVSSCGMTVMAVVSFPFVVAPVLLVMVAHDSSAIHNDGTNEGTKTKTT